MLSRTPAATQRPKSGRERLSSFLRGRRAVALWLVLGCLVVYNGNARFIGSADSVPARLLPFSILLDHTLTLDRFFAAQVGGARSLARAPRAEQMRYYYLTPRRGRLYSTYPIALPVVITPLYAPLVWAKRGWSTAAVRSVAAVAEKLTASLIAALSVAAMYLLLCRLSDRGAALALSLTFAFATTTWTTSSQALWQHGAGVLCMLLALGALVWRPGADWLAGLFAGLAVAIRPDNLFFWLALLAACAWSWRSLPRLAALALPGVGLNLPVAAYNLAVFGNLLGGYARADDAFRGDFVRGLAGLLASPSRGLFIYSPVLLAGVAGLYFALRSRLIPRSPVYTAAALFLAVNLPFLALWQAWWGGWSYGPRLLTELAAMLVVLAVPAVERLRRRREARLAFAVLLAYSVAVQALGAAAWGTPDEWDAVPVSVDARPSRLWSWRDAQIPRTAPILRRDGWLGLVRAGLQRRRVPRS